MEGYSYRDSKEGRVICGTCELIVRKADSWEIDGLVYGREMADEFVQRQGQIIDIVNSKLAHWNEIWDQRTGGRMMEEGDFYWDLYAMYLAGLERSVCVNDNLQHPDSRIMMDCIHKGGIPKIIGIVDRDPDTYYEFMFPGEERN